MKASVYLSRFSLGSLEWPTTVLWRAPRSNLCRYGPYLQLPSGASADLCRESNRRELRRSSVLPRHDWLAFRVPRHTSPDISRLLPLVVGGDLRCHRSCRNHSSQG